MRRIKKKKERPLTHDQWIEITCKDGKTVTTFYPPNDEFERLRLEMDPPPALIYRRLNFVHGVPWEYGWTNPPEQVAIWGGCLLQRMKVEEWPKVMQRERAIGNRLALPCDNPQERPPELGPCPCDRCTKNREMANKVM